MKSVPGTQKISKSDHIGTIELDDSPAALANHMIMRLLGKGMFITDEFIAELDRLDDPTVYQQGQCTVVTGGWGKLKGKRVIRGAERMCGRYYGL